MKLISIIFCVFLSIAVFYPSCSQALCVEASTANVRSGPGTEYEKMWQVYRFMPLKQVGVSLSGDWYAVKDVDGDVGWIYKALLTGKYRCAIVKSKTVNVRTGPGAGYPKRYSKPAEQYDTFKILRLQSVWAKVKNEGNDTGWIHKRYLWID